MIAVFIFLENFHFSISPIIYYSRTFIIIRILLLLQSFSIFISLIAITNKMSFLNSLQHFLQTEEGYDQGIY